MARSFCLGVSTDVVKVFIAKAQISPGPPLKNRDHHSSVEKEVKNLSLSLMSSQEAPAAFDTASVSTFPFGWRIF